MWDDKSREAIGVTWGRVFAEETKQILDDVQNGSMEALNKWMENGRLRVLPDVDCFMLPPIEFV